MGYHLRELSLFSGAGGGVLGGKLLGFNCIGYVEYEKYCQQNIRQRITDSLLDAAPIFGDIRRFISEGYADQYKGMVDVLTGGFPCQPFSVAGKKAGADDPRNMWPQTIECLRRVRPRYGFFENVPGLLNSGYFPTILREISESGYAVQWCTLGADDVGAPHRRKRIWILAYSQHHGLPGCEEPESTGPRGNEATGERRAEQSAGPVGGTGGDADLAYPPGANGSRKLQEPGIKSRISQERMSPGGCGGISWWDKDPADVLDTDQHDEQPKRGLQEGEAPTTARSGEERRGAVKSRLGRVAHGVANRVDRLKAIGNGQVPAVAAAAWRILTQDLS